MDARPKKINNNTINPEQGVTLMLAVLVLAAVIAVAFSLATIVFIEIKSAGDALRTEPAVYATIGVTEEALFQYKRFITPIEYNNFNVPSCEPAGLSVCNINNVTLTLPGTQPIRYDDSPKIQVIPRRTKISLPMYVADDFTKQYLDVKVEMLPIGSGVDLKVNLSKTEENGNVIPEVLPDTLISEGGVAFDYPSFDSSGQYDLILDNLDNDVDVTVSITTIRVGGPLTLPAGLPFTGEQVMRIVANYLGLTRTYQVRIPIP